METKQQNLSTWDIDNALANAGSAEMYRYFHDLGYSVSMDCLVVDNEHPITDFEVIKFLRSVGAEAEWSENIMPTIVSEGTLEMIQFAHGPQMISMSMVNNSN